MANGIIQTTSNLTLADLWDTFLARVGWKRSNHRVPPRLYALGTATPESPVFVTGNYTLSFNALRSALKGMNAWILVLNTHGINVWCAAGKGSFGTQELINRINTTGLKDIVTTRVLILPQLGAPGVAAHEVKKATTFRVEYGPVRAEDLPVYLVEHKATPEMREVRFNLADRLTLIPVEVVNYGLPMLAAVVVFYLLGGWLSAAAAACAVLSGTVLFPALLPWIPTRDFSTKGFIIGLLVALPFAIAHFLGAPAQDWKALLGALPFLLGIPAVSAYIALNFTGSSPIASRSGVRREIYRYIPIMAWLAGISVVALIASLVLRMVKG